MKTIIFILAIITAITTKSFSQQWVQTGGIPDGAGVTEIVVTPLQIEGMPLVRFRTGDISFIPYSHPIGSCQLLSGSMKGKISINFTLL